MTILSYIGFTKQYHSLTQQICAFLKYNFKGTHAIVERSGKRYSLAINQIQETDFLYKIERFPVSLKQLTVVNDRLKRSLRTNGMLRFEVMRPVTLTLNNQRDLICLINQVRTQSNSLF
jgi:predicted nucleotidyltransferase